MKQNYRVIIDKDHSQSHKSIVQLIYKDSWQIKLIGLERPDGLYKALLRINKNEVAFATKHRTAMSYI